MGAKSSTTAKVSIELSVSIVTISPLEVDSIIETKADEIIDVHHGVVTRGREIIVGNSRLNETSLSLVE
jgi:hypothetical protein